MQLTYYEFAKEELETLDNGAPPTGSSFTTSSSDDLDSGQHLDRQTPQDSDALDAEQQHAQQREAAGLEPVRPYCFRHLPPSTLTPLFPPTNAPVT